MRAVMAEPFRRRSPAVWLGLALLGIVGGPLPPARAQTRPAVDSAGGEAAGEDPPTVLAPGDPPPAAAAPPADLWREVRSPGWLRSRALLRQGRERLATAGSAQSFGRNEAFVLAHLEAAEARFARARALAPDDPEAAFDLARALYMRSQALGEAELRERTVAILLEVRRLDIHFRAATIASLLAILHTHAGRFAEATAEHDRALRRSLDPSRDWTETANLAESAMLTGDLTRAVALYERSLRLARTRGSSATVGRDHLWVGVLSLWGLAVALDRLGERAAALERAGEALAVGTGDAALRVLRDESVFYEPPEEVYWYEALGYEAMARREPANAAAFHEQALRRWYRYLRAGGEEGPWAGLARRHIGRLEEGGR